MSGVLRSQWLKLYKEERTHQGRWCYGKTPMQTFIDKYPIGQREDVGGVSGGPTITDDEDLSVDCQMMC